jgi:hypothetical protein
VGTTSIQFPVVAGATGVEAVLLCTGAASNDVWRRRKRRAMVVRRIVTHNENSIRCAYAEACRHEESSKY